MARLARHIIALIFAIGCVTPSQAFVLALYGSGLMFPTDTFTVNDDGFFGPNASILQVQVPEPATLALILFALVGLGFSRRKRAHHLRH